MKKRNVLKWIIFGIALAINIFIIVNSFITGDASTAESNAVINTTANVVNSLSPGLVTSSNFNNFVGLIRKLFGHFGLFAISGLITTWSLYLFLKGQKHGYFLDIIGISFLDGLVVAWVSEFVQLFVPGRSGSAADVLIDMIGYFIGVLLVILILFLAKKPIFSKIEQEEKWVVDGSLFY
mgnify:CR=1 FL=1